MKTPYTYGSRVLALLLAFATGCGPMSHSTSLSHLSAADDDDDPDEGEDGEAAASARLDAATHALEDTLRMSADPAIDGPTLYTSIDGAGGVDIGTVTIHGPAPSTVTDDLGGNDAWVDGDQVHDLLWNMQQDIKHFQDQNADISTKGDAAHGSSVPAAPQLNPADYPYKTPVNSPDGQRLAQAWLYEQAVQNNISDADVRARQKHQLVDSADGSLRNADTSFGKGDTASGEFLLQLANTILNAAVNPGAGRWTTNTYMAFTGYDPGSNLQVSTFFQGSAMASTAIFVGAECSAAGVFVTVGTGVALIAALVGAVHSIVGNIEGLVKNATDIADAISGEKDASTPTGSKGIDYRVQPGTNTPATIGGRDYTGHALDQMQGRGIPPSAVEDAIQHGSKSPGNSPGTTVNVGQNGVTAVTNAEGKVVTTWTK